MTIILCDNIYQMIIEISIAIVVTVIVAQLINHALAAYFKSASRKLKVDETTYIVVRRLILVTIYLIGVIVVISLVPGLPDLVYGVAVSAGIAAIVMAQSTFLVKSIYPLILPQSAQRTQRHLKTQTWIETLLNSVPSAISALSNH